MACDGMEAETGKKLPERRGSMVIHGKFDELDAETMRPRWQPRLIHADQFKFFPHLIHQIDQ